MRAAIDVGTNTVRLLLGESRDGLLHPARYYRKITRLGGGFKPERGLADAAMDRTLSALKEISLILASVEVEKTRAVGTAALRKARNGTEFAARVKKETGLPLRIIDGNEEALLCGRGVLSALDPIPAHSLIFDIGGGSTEFILCAESVVTFHKSFPLGVVGLVENLPSSSAQEAYIDEILQNLVKDLEAHGATDGIFSCEGALIGTAGTVTTLAALRLKMTEYDWRRVNNLVLSGDELRFLYRLLEPLSLSDRESLPGMEKGRGDLILPGLRIVNAVLGCFRKDRLRVSDFGLLEGLLLNQ